MTINHATHKPTIERSNRVIARPLEQLRAILAKELVHTKTNPQFNTNLLLHKTKDNYDSCSYVTQSIGPVKPSQYSSKLDGCAYLRVCNSCGMAGGYKQCKNCCKNMQHSKTTLMWMCEHTMERIAKIYKVRSVFQGELSKYFCAKTMSYVGNFDNWEGVVDNL